MANFPGVIGCIDCTHIRIQAPHLNENYYVNRKRYHSINVQAICDDRGKFINLVARWPGSVHDSHIFRMSQIQQFIEQHHTSLEDGIILGDSGYALKPYLMTPYTDPTTAKERAFNRSLKKTRVLIEQVFGRWKRRFHLLHSEIRMEPEKVCLLIGACAVLQNIAIMFNEPDEEEDVDLEEPDPEVEPQVGHDTGRQIRAHITNNFF
ncbi:putative nuclease HARBI1 [Dendronephthya gigantea]|uniref:putative nuclease HARBI1 n=1 Tax=Dendronephthya gigantea TaxID=151771 RepID=UPI00106BC78A|nr:putative nuclease HARBI1 [Dendronephthya gigantea]